MRHLAVAALLVFSGAATSAQAQQPLQLAPTQGQGQTPATTQTTPATEGAAEEPEGQVCAAPLTASASLVDVVGRVSVSRAGGEFTDVVGGAPLNVGDRVMVQEGGDAVLLLGGCRYELSDGSLVTIEQEGEFLVAYDALETEIIPAAFPIIPAVAAGGAAAAGGVAAATAGAGDNGQSPASLGGGTGGAAPAVVPPAPPS